jgi:uncharacterized protein with ATP-grasp and redox domains
MIVAPLQESSMAKIPNPILREAFLQIVRNQLRNGKPPETKATLERLMAEGYSRDHSMKLIAAVVATEIVDVLNENEPYKEARYLAALQNLPKLPFDEN